MREPNFTKLGKDIDHRSIAVLFQISDMDASSNAGGSKLSEVLNDAKFRTI